jgi:membrane protein implicated in regulation of membrane protease activity
MALAHSMKGGSGGNMTFVWIAAIVIFGIAEAATAGLVSIWFVAGAVAALLALELGAVLWLQIVVFLAVSIAALVATRPLAHKMLDKTIVPTNADRVLHHTAKVTETIDNENTTGAVYIDGKTWTARSEDGDVIARGAMVTIVRMEGVKLFVRKEREEP